jgi:hypothetical protein
MWKGKNVTDINKSLSEKNEKKEDQNIIIYL